MPLPVRAQVVRLNDVADLAAAVPHLLGFHPCESLVLVALKGPRRRVVFQMRLDLAGLPSWSPAALVASLLRAEADTVVALVYTETPGDGCDFPHALVIDELGRRLDEAGAPLLDALLVRSGRWWSYLCADAGCCPPTGNELPSGTSPAEVAVAVQLGQATLPDRAALVASIAPYGGIAGAAMEQAVRGVVHELAGLQRSQIAAGSLAAFDVALARFRQPPAKLAHDEAARILVGLTDVEVRDDIARRCMAAGDDALFTVLHALCRLAPTDYAAPIYSLLGAAAYARGNGALAAIAFERALTADPGYSLARLLDEALQRQVTPTMLRRTWSPVRAARRPKRR